MARAHATYCRHLTPEMVHMAQVMDAASRHMRECRRLRICVWCADPVEDHYQYPACGECREYRGVESP